MSDPDLWHAQLHPDDRDAVMTANRISNERVEHFVAEYRLRAKDGTWHWIRDEAAPMRDTDGTLVFWRGVMLDITERKEAEEEARVARERLQALIDNIPAVVYVETPGGDAEGFFLSALRGASARLHARRVDVDAGLLARPPPPRRSPARQGPGRRHGSLPRAATPPPTGSAPPTDAGSGSTTRRPSWRARTGTGSGRASCSTSPNAWRPSRASGGASTCCGGPCSSGASWPNGCSRPRRRSGAASPPTCTTTPSR